MDGQSAKFNHILCPVDFSTGSLNALVLAGALARAHAARVTVLHVLTVTMPEPETPPVGVGTPAAPGEREVVRLRLEDTAAERVGPGVTMDVSVTAGDPVQAILDCVRSRTIDLLVMGTHGTGGLQRLLLGSVTEKVLRQAPCAVLTVPPGAQERTPAAFRNVLAAVDFSDCASRAARFAAAIAAAARATLTLVHVIDWPWHDDPDTPIAGVPAGQAQAAAEYQRYLRASARERLDALVNTVTPAHPAKTRLSVGRPYQEILDVAKADGADLIVLGVQGRGAVDLAFFGSTANHVVRAATCPVLTVRESPPS